MNALVPVHNDNHRPSLARMKLEELVARGRLQAGAVIRRILADKPTDHLIPARSIGFRVDDATAVHAVTFGWDEPLHPHALRQVVAKVGLPPSFGRTSPKELLSASKVYDPAACEIQNGPRAAPHAVRLPRPPLELALVRGTA